MEEGKQIQWQEQYRAETEKKPQEAGHTFVENVNTKKANELYKMFSALSKNGKLSLFKDEVYTVSASII